MNIEILKIVLITIAGVHVVNFIVLALDEEFGWKYEDYAKRFCCLSAYLVMFLFVVIPVKIYRKFNKRKIRS